MAAFKDHQAADRTKILVVGEGGAGKTALLASLANAGYKLRILDYDGGLDILHSFVNPDAIDNIIYRTCTDNTVNDATGFLKGANLLFTGWKTEDEDLGHIKTWDKTHVLVVDSLTFMSEAAKRVALKSSGRHPTDNLTQADWGTAQRLIDNVLTLLASDAVKCNVVVLSHPVFVSDEHGANRMFPSACGQGLSTRVSLYFNNMVRLDVKRKGKDIVRTFRTVSDHKMSLKNSAPNVVKDDEPADLAALLAKLQGAAAQAA